MVDFAKIYKKITYEEFLILKLIINLESISAIKLAKVLKGQMNYLKVIRTIKKFAEEKIIIIIGKSPMICEIDYRNKETLILFKKQLEEKKFNMTKITQNI